jgi:hypothetical protein
MLKSISLILLDFYNSKIMKIAIKKYNFGPKYLIYSTKLLYTYIFFDLNNGLFIVVKFLFWNCHIKALDNGDLVLIIFACGHVWTKFLASFSLHFWQIDEGSSRQTTFQCWLFKSFVITMLMFGRRSLKKTQQDFYFRTAIFTNSAAAALAFLLTYIEETS